MEKKREGEEGVDFTAASNNYQNLFIVLTRGIVARKII